MQPYRDLRILNKLEEADKYSRIAMRQFPKYEKFILAGEIRAALLAIRRLIIRAAKKYRKKTTLQDLDIEIEVLRSYIRTAYRLAYINEDRLGVWLGHVDVVGKMVGAWLAKEGEKENA